MFHRMGSLFAAGLMLTFAASSRADVIFVSANLNETILLDSQDGGDIGEDSPTSFIWNDNFTRNFVLPQFDASLGTLTNVEISFSGEFFLDTSIDYNHEDFVNGADVVVSGTTNLSLADATSAVTTDTAISNSLNFQILPGLGSQFVVIGESTFSGAATSVPTDQLAAYVGNGNVMLPLTVEFSGSATFSKGLIGVTPQLTLDSSQVTIAYTFTAVPEPSLGLLAAMCMPGLSMLRRRRFNSATI